MRLLLVSLIFSLSFGASAQDENVVGESASSAALGTLEQNALIQKTLDGLVSEILAAPKFSGILTQLDAKVEILDPASSVLNMRVSINTGVNETFWDSNTPGASRGAEIGFSTFYNAHRSNETSANGQELFDVEGVAQLGVTTSVLNFFKSLLTEKLNSKCDLDVSFYAGDEVYNEVCREYLPLIKAASNYSTAEALVYSAFHKYKARLLWLHVQALASGLVEKDSASLSEEELSQKSQDTVVIDNYEFIEAINMAFSDAGELQVRIDLKNSLKDVIHIPGLAKDKPVEKAAVLLTVTEESVSAAFIFDLQMSEKFIEFHKNSIVGALSEVKAKIDAEGLNKLRESLKYYVFFAQALAK